MKMRFIAAFAAGAALRGTVPMSDAERRKGRFLRDGTGHIDFKGKAPEQIAEELTKSIEKQHQDVLKKADDALSEAKKSGELSVETKNSVDQALTGINTLREQLAAIEQKMATKPGADGPAVKSYGAQVSESERFKTFKSTSYQGSARFELKAITAAQAGTAWSQRDNETVGLPKQRITVRDLLSVVPTTSGSVDYAKQTTRTNNAAAVAEQAAKPTSNYIWTQANAPMRVIAHLAKITRQALDDAVQLQGEIDAEMRYGLALAEETELLTGDGTGAHLTGLIPAATAFSAPITISSPTPIDNLRLALLQAELALYPSDGMVLSLQDWARIELTKTTTGEYVFANPLQLAGPRLWAKPVVATPSMTIDKFLVGGFKLQTLYDRMAPEVLIASENADDFEKNLYTMRCEERLALAIKRPASLIYGDFGFVA